MKRQRKARRFDFDATPAVQAAADARALLRRLAKQAADAANTPPDGVRGAGSREARASRPPCGPAPVVARSRTEGGSKKESGKTRDSDLSTADSALLFRRVASRPRPPPPRVAARRGVAARGDAERRGAAVYDAGGGGGAGASRSGADGQRANPNELYPPPKGLALSAGYPSGRESAMERARGAAACCARAVWDAHGVPSMARMHARAPPMRRVEERSTGRRDGRRQRSPKSSRESFRRRGGSTRSSHGADSRTRLPPPRATPPPRWRSSRVTTRRRTTAPGRRRRRTSQSPPRDSRSAEWRSVAAAPTPRRRRRASATGARAGGDGDACDAAARRIASLAPASTRTDPEARVEARGPRRRLFNLRRAGRRRVSRVRGLEVRSARV